MVTYLPSHKLSLLDKQYMLGTAKVVKKNLSTFSDGLQRIDTPVLPDLQKLMFISSVLKVKEIREYDEYPSTS